MVKRKIFGTLPAILSMSSLRNSIILLFVLLCGTTQVLATHLIGGYMSYEFVEKINNDYRYKVTLYMFRDMEQSDVDFDDEISIGIYLNNKSLDRNSIAKINLVYRKQVKPPGNEECGYYADKKIEMAFYEKVITLAAYPEGYHLSFVRCCRNIQDNLTLNDGKPYQGQTYYCFIPNPALRNSSPRFSGVPSPYMCARDTTTFLNRAVDKDGDSLVYRIALPFQGGEPTQGGAVPDPPLNLLLPIKPVQYKGGYNFVSPFGSSGMVQINPNNGLTTSYATNLGSYVVAIEVSEYRNGILLSTVRLDMQILVLNCPPNNKPTAKSPTGKYFEIEAGEKLCINLQGTNADLKPQNVTLFATGDILTGENGVKPPLAVMATKVGSDFVESELCWTPACDQARDKPYLVTVTARDDGCPPKEDNINIEIKVNKFVGSKEITGPSRACSGSISTNTYQAKNPTHGKKFWWEAIGGEIIGVKDQETVNIRWTSATTGRVRMVEISQYGCPGDTVVYNVVLVPAPTKPIISGRDTVCLNAINVIYTVPSNSGSTYTWRLPDGTFRKGTSASLAVNWNQLGDFTIGSVETNLDGCNSDTAIFKVNVRLPAPEVKGPNSVCPNSSGIIYEAFGLAGSTYTWTITGGTKVSGGNSKRIGINWGNAGQGVIEVVETDKFGCVSNVISYIVNKTYALTGVEPLGDLSVCEFDANVPYKVLESAGSTYRWNISGGNQVKGDSSSNIEVTWGAFGLGRVGVQEWAWDPVNKKECVSQTKFIDVDINPVPTADKIVGDFEVCEGNDEYFYKVNGFQGSRYTWTINGSTQNISGQGTSIINFTWSTPGTFAITVLEMSVDSCPGVLIDTIMVVHPKPISDLISGLLVHCIPNVNNTQYVVKGYPNSTFHWTIANGTYVGGTNDTILVNWLSQGFGSIQMVEISEYGCVGDTLMLPVYISDLKLDLEVVSVGFPDNRMHGSWLSLNDELTSRSFDVQKRIPGAEPAWNSVVKEDNLSFLETGINTDLTPFEYRIIGYDLCGNERISDVHTSMLLTGTQDEDDFSLTLNFTPYKGWEEGVLKYELYKSINEDRSLRFHQSVTENVPIMMEGNSDNFRQCYRIQATELNGGNKVSWSNEICFFFQPNIYVPTAFTPNSDGKNEGFRPVSVAVQDYSLTVFNRWGEKLFETNDQQASWDGTYQDRESPPGIYVYLITFTDYKKMTYQKNGTVQLIR